VEPAAVLALEELEAWSAVTAIRAFLECHRTADAEPEHESQVRRLAQASLSLSARARDVLANGQPGGPPEDRS